MFRGVGFHWPFVKRLADRLELPGIAFNTASGLIVEIDSNTKQQALEFMETLRQEAPAAAKIEQCLLEEVAEETHYSNFRIVASARRDASFTLISSDLAICQLCAAEIADPANRRFQYPFTNCTNCGPRYSITISTPYDRANTTMKRFTMCAECAAEYADPARSTLSCRTRLPAPVCGPRLSMELRDCNRESGKRSRFLAIKGLGGFQLACNARFAKRLSRRLRLRKRRSRKPFAIMMRDLATAERYCVIWWTMPSARSAAADFAPVVLLRHERRRAVCRRASHRALRQIGVMLPYTPLHQLLFTGSVDCMVMTSGNISEEPIVIDNNEAAAKLSSIADQLLTHDRDIFLRVDDSVARNFEGVPRVLRRARGYAPNTITLRHEVDEVLATGAELKNTFCITKGRYAIPSQHIGDLENYETLQFFEETLRNLQSVYQAKPKLVVHDLHPDYLSTRWALARPEPKLAVQHHHAHIASCMAENGVSGKVIGVAFDGTGLGTDGQIWGGEFLICDYHAYRRYAHLRYVALPGGDRAARESWRMAAAHLYDALGPQFRDIDLPCWSVASETSWKVIHQADRKPAIRTSSCGRLFDAVSAICGISQENSYEGESAMLLEAAAQGERWRTAYRIRRSTPRQTPWTIDTRPMIREIA